jgi:phenylacetic acid degradation protein PaaD
MRLDGVAPGTARLSMTIRADMTNGHGIAHGGFIFALADSAFAFACNTYNVRTVAQSCDILFVAAARTGDLLTATAAERHRYGRNGLYDIRVARDDDVIAEFRGRSRTIGGTVVDTGSGGEE